jgi:SPP1 family predicted phage head-tail adaptor
VRAVRIGDLRHKLVLESETRLPDGGGGATVGWTPVAEVWASVKPVSGEEKVMAEAITGQVSHLVVVRRRDGVTPAMRFRMADRILAILSVLDLDERRRWLVCRCREENL